MKKLRVTVQGRTYDVTVELLDPSGADSSPIPAAPNVSAPAPAPVAAAALPSPTVASPPSAAPAGANAVISPLAGKVVAIDVKLGQVVAEGTQLVTLEAMKMNTFVYAPKSGTVAAINVAPGDAVDEGAPLLMLA